MKNREKHLKDGFLEAYELYSDAIFRYCMLRLGDKELALDLSQDTFMKTWNHISKGGEVTNLRAFLYKVAGNLIIDEYRRRKPQSSLDTLSEETGFEPAFDDYHDMVNKLDGRGALELLSQIPESYRDALYMKFVEGLSLGEMAQITGENENALAVRVHRGISKLKKLFEHEE